MRWEKSEEKASRCNRLWLEWTQSHFTHNNLYRLALFCAFNWIREGESTNRMRHEWARARDHRKGEGWIINKFFDWFFIQLSILCERRERVKWKENSHFPPVVLLVCYKMLKINLLISNEPRTNHVSFRLSVHNAASWRESVRESSMLWPLSSEFFEASSNWDTISNLFTFCHATLDNYVTINIETHHTWMPFYKKSLSKKDFILITQNEQRRRCSPLSKSFSFLASNVVCSSWILRQINWLVEILNVALIDTYG